jgi:serine phosphatase RsbU (regulator of sigma subunit)
MAMKTNINILLLEDDPADAELIKRELKSAGLQFNMQVVSDRPNFLKGLSEFRPDVILSDHSLTSFNSLEAFSIVKKDHNAIPFIIVTGAASEEFAVICMKAGVRDYILKKNLKRLPAAIQQVMENDSVTREKEKMKQLERKLKHAFLEIKEKSRTITESVIYTQKIQSAMLPEKEKLARFFPEWFILNQPKDVISGDFYWFQKTENKLIFAIADCTGHGVAGTLMSIVGIELLNRIVKEKNIIKPSEILRNLNMEFSRFLKPDNSIDGISIALFSINLNTHFIEFSGAGRPIWLMRKTGLDEVNGSRPSVGGMLALESRYYETHYLQSFSGDILYLFTDGFLNQFGGSRDKKLMKKKFRSLLSSISGIQLHDQKIILKRFINEWKGDNEQVDDILVIALKI